jgi:mono/diheme cytochrome c family protein
MEAGFLGLALFFASASCEAQAQTQTHPLVWDAFFKTNQVKSGATNVQFTFSATNRSNTDVTINRLHTSCGCTLVKLPSNPWILAPGKSGSVEVSVDLRGKRGNLNKFISVDTSAGFQALRFRVEIQEDPTKTDSRERNQMAALGDRQAIFKNDCVQCHVAPTVGKLGEALYDTACTICHETPRRASMVPELLGFMRPAEYWRQWTREGLAGTLMPGFAKSEGGPLTDHQIESLVAYLTTDFLTRKPEEMSVPTNRVSSSNPTP